MTVKNTTPSAIDLLAFHVEAGADTALTDQPVDRFAESVSETAARVEKNFTAPRSSITSPLAGEAGRPPADVLDVKDADAEHRLWSEARREGVNAPPHDPSPKSLRRFDPPLFGEGKSAAPLPAADAAVSAARTAAAHAKTLDELRDTLARFEGCALKATAKNLVFADGNPQARAMFVGEAPGADEDREGLPFVGRSGKLLDRMMAAIGLDRTSAYIANIVPWRPPGNRTPTPQETAACFPFITRQIELANPDVLVCLGGPATLALLGAREGITKSRGRWFDYDTGTRTIKALATFHPAYLLRTPVAKRLAWRDMLALKKALSP
jgi:DNA polymerase